MTIHVVMPQLGESVVEGTITRWHVKPGDRIEKDAVLVTVSTDKADTDVPSPATGVVTRLLAAEQQVVPVNQPIAELDNAASATAPAPAAAPAPVSTPAPAAAAPTSPVVRKLSRELDVDLSAVRGSGENGRVTRDDVLAAASPRAASPAAAPVRCRRLRPWSRPPSRPLRRRWCLRLRCRSPRRRAEPFR
jgi:pyruvate/2-oxoglutarate dehydrogenase complex dihydrolipoamide acyltransferase (E2) component